MTVALHPDILTSLQSVREDVRRKVAGLDRYRALKAIEQTIADFPGLDDLANSLSDIRNRVQEQLDETREFRALRALERIMPELSEVLALVEDGSAADDHDLQASPEPESTTAATTSGEPASADGPDGAHADAHAVEIDVRSMESAVIFAVDEADAVRVFAESSDGTSDVGVTGQAEPEHRAPKRDAMPEEVQATPVPSLADSVAQLMAQSMAPPRDPHGTPPAHPQERSDIALPQAERAA